MSLESHFDVKTRLLKAIAILNYMRKYIVPVFLDMMISLSAIVNLWLFGQKFEKKHLFYGYVLIYKNLGTSYLDPWLFF